MPAPNTKRLLVEGREVYLPAHEVDLAEAIAIGLAAQEDWEAARARLDAARVRVLELLEPGREGRSSITVEGRLGGKVQAKWPTETVLDQHLVVELKQRLPPEVFDRLFTAHTEFRLTRAYSAWMKTPQGPDLERHKGVIGSAVTRKSKNPSVKFFATDEGPDGSED